MQTVWALAVLLSLVVGTCCLPLLIWRRLRRRAGLTLCLSLIATAASVVQFERSPPLNVAQSESEPPASVVPVAASLEVPAPAAPLPRAPEPARSPKAGVAKICLLDDDVRLKPTEGIELPATTVFEDNGRNTGQVEDPETWAYEVKEGFKRKAAIITQAAVMLTRKTPCATAPVKMYIAPLFEETAQAAADGHVFAIDDVIDYPIPAKRPPVEIGKLIDDISVKAVLTADVSDTVEAPRNTLSDAEIAAACLSGGKKLAAHVGGGVSRQTSAIVSLGGVPAHESSFGCALPPMRGPSFFASWDGSARPPAATLGYISKAGEFLTGAAAAELTKEAQACVAAALKPGSMEGGERLFRGVKLECQAFARDGGGGAITIYRRFGAYPERPDPAPQVAASTEEASRRLTAEASVKDAQGQASMKAFAEWWEDPAIPKDVKVFAMMSSRVIALEERCPSGRKHSLTVAAWASSAGIEPEDIGPGGRYHRLMVGVLSSLREGVAKESVQSACDALRKYD